MTVLNFNWWTVRPSCSSWTLSSKSVPINECEPVFIAAPVECSLYQTPPVSLGDSIPFKPFHIHQAKITNAILERRDNDGTCSIFVRKGREVGCPSRTKNCGKTFLHCEDLIR